VGRNDRAHRARHCADRARERSVVGYKAKQRAADAASKPRAGKPRGAASQNLEQSLTCRETGSLALGLPTGGLLADAARLALAPEANSYAVAVRCSALSTIVEPAVLRRAFSSFLDSKNSGLRQWCYEDAIDLAVLLAQRLLVGNLTGSPSRCR
jgi:hypothetical protein